MNEKSIGKYRTLELLGRGGMAEVYLGYDPILDRRVAIKVILPHLVEEVSFEQRFRQEARLVAGLRHPNIVQIHEFDFHDGQPFMVMEYFEGGTLKDVLAKYKANGKTIPLGEIARLLEAIASALDYAHRSGTVHRDIKPSNILFSPGGEPVIVDFGIAKILDESLHLTVTGGIVGSPHYMSPEQAASKPVDKYSDIYSLGIMVYEMTTGRVPFIGDSITGVLMQHLNNQPPPIREFNPNIPVPLQEVITRVLAKNPEDRYASAGEFAEAFRMALGGSAPAMVSSEAETLLQEHEKPAEYPPPTLEMSEVTSETHPPVVNADIEPKPNTPEPVRNRRRYLLFVVGVLVLIILGGAIALINPGGIISSTGVIDLPIGSYDEDGEVLLYTSLDDGDAITSPKVGIPGTYSLQEDDFVAAKIGGGILFNREGGCGIDDYQEVSFPAWKGDDMNVNLEDGELTFWYQPLYDATDSEGLYSLVNITLDGDTHSSIYLDFNEGFFGLNLVDKEWNWMGTSAGYRAPLWKSGEWVFIRAVWDSWNNEDSLQLYVNDLRVDSGGEPGGWAMNAEEFAVRIFVGTYASCGESSANGIIDELTIRHFP